MQRSQQEWLPTPEKAFVAASEAEVGKGGRTRLGGNCPVCGLEVNPRSIQIDAESFVFLKKLAREGTLRAFLQIARVHIYDIMRMGAPTAAGFTRAVSSLQEELRSVTNQGLEALKADLSSKFQQVLAEMGFPEPTQMRLLAQFVPTAVDLMRQLIQLQTVPAEKGREGERTLLDELTSYFPEDEIVPLGKSGETDIVARPSHEGQSVGTEVLIESKRNSQAGWRRSYIEEVLRHMSNHNSKYAILAVDVMPKGANGYLTEYHSEGVIFVTCRDTCHIAYGAIRAALVTVVKLAKRSIDVARALSDRRIAEKIQSLYEFEKYHRRIRENAAAVVSKGRKIVEDTDDASDFLREALGDIQKTIQEVTNESEGAISP